MTSGRWLLGGMWWTLCRLWCSVNPMDAKRGSLEERFWSKVDTSGDCWEWTGSRNDRGYGCIRIDGRTRQVHRVAWVLQRGSIPDGVNVLHHCDNPSCVRAEHLFLGTKKDNSQDMARKGRWRNQYMDGSSTDLCSRGHVRGALPSGKVVCRICRRKTSAAYKQRQISKRPPRLCLECGAPFPAFGKRLYCSDRCKWRTSNRRRARS